MRIEALAVSHTYDRGTPLSRDALCDVSLTISAGERVGILGPTGSGKSTLAQIIAGLLFPTAGQVLYDCVGVRRSSIGNRRRRVGFALQYPEDQFFERTIFDEVAFAPRRSGLGGVETLKRVYWALERVGLSPAELADRSPFTLSGGEMRRVALASVLSLRPEVLILDEPTAGLDPRGRRELFDLLNQLHEETSLTLIVISHDLEVIARLVDRVMVLCEGRLIADGPVRSIFSDQELPARAGFIPPAAVALLRTLKDAGWPLSGDQILPEEAAAEIYRAWRSLEQQR